MNEHPRLTAAVRAVFRKPHGWQVDVYLAGARRIAGWADWLAYRASEWVMELEDL